MVSVLWRMSLCSTAIRLSLPATSSVMVRISPFSRSTSMVRRFISARMPSVEASMVSISAVIRS